MIKINNPDLVLFVGEALVGNEAVDQLKKFNRALADFSDHNNPHLIDGILLTKFDTIDDKVRRRRSEINAVIIYLGTCRRILHFRILIFVFCSGLGWRCYINDVYDWPANRFCGNRADVYRFKESECESSCSRFAQSLNEETERNSFFV